jgi:hypothetical protein
MVKRKNFQGAVYTIADYITQTCEDDGIPPDVENALGVLYSLVAEQIEIKLKIIEEEMDLAQEEL